MLLLECANTAARKGIYCSNCLECSETNFFHRKKNSQNTEELTSVSTLASAINSILLVVKNRKFVIGGLIKENKQRRLTV